MKLKSIVFLGILSVSGSLLFSQNDNEKSIEEIYLQNPELMVIREQVLSDDLQTELQALEGIDGLIKGGTVNNEIENLLISLGESWSASKKYLGQIGTDKAREALITILLSESDDTVRAEAAYALGIIGRDEKGDATGAIAWVIDKEDPVSPDNNFAYAATLAFEKIAEKNHGLKNSAGYAALIKIAQGNYIRTVKDKALEVIKGMKKYSR
jgi:hypothetical protein